MKKEIARKWAQALRSGKYTQTRLTLHDEKGFCCLGVLCDISGLGEWVGLSDSRSYIPHEDGIEGEMVRLPRAVMEWADIRTNEGEFVGAKAKTSLAAANDAGNPFYRIADTIEKKWKEL